MEGGGEETPLLCGSRAGGAVRGDGDALPGAGSRSPPGRAGGAGGPQPGPGAERGGAARPSGHRTMAAAAEEPEGRRGRGPRPGPAPGSPAGRAVGEGSPGGGGRRVFSPAGEFREFSRRQLRDMERLFRQ